MVRFADTENWSGQFDAVNEIRVMQKYHSDKLMENLGNFTQFIHDSVDNLRSGISKNALMLTTELSLNDNALGVTAKDSEKNRDKTIKFIQSVVPVLLFKTVYDKVFISKEAKNSIGNLLKPGMCM